MSFPQVLCKNSSKFDNIKTIKRSRVLTEPDRFVSKRDLIDNLQDDEDIPDPSDLQVLEKMTLNPNSLREVLMRQRLKHYHSVLGHHNFRQKLSQQKIKENNQSNNNESSQLDVLFKRLEMQGSKKGFDLDMMLSPYFEQIKIQSPNKSPRKVELKPLAKFTIERQITERLSFGIKLETCKSSIFNKQQSQFRQDCQDINFDKVMENQPMSFGSVNSSPRQLIDREISFGNKNDRALNFVDNRQRNFKSRFLQSLNTMPIQQ